MDEIARHVEQVKAATSWNDRIQLIRKIPELFGLAQHATVYPEIARHVYVPYLGPDFAYVHWRPEYELETIEHAYGETARLTNGFERVLSTDIATVIHASPTTLRIFRLLVGLTTQEFAASIGIVAAEQGSKSIGNDRVKRIEGGAACNEETAALCAETVSRIMNGSLFAAPDDPNLRSKIQKPDTIGGWESVRMFARNGVPLSMFLHQRLYGGAFNQLLNATSKSRGDNLEDTVEGLVRQRRVPYLRVGLGNQEEVAKRFSITVRPAPDFIFHDSSGTLRAMLECKQTNDGGTARDKAARISALREEAKRLGGVPVFAVVAGLGWTRTRDALVES